MAVFNESSLEAVNSMIGRYPTVVFSGLTSFLVYILSRKALCNDWQRMKAISMECTF